MNRWSNIYLPFLVAALASRFVGLSFWESAKQGLLVGLSVIAAGVLVRLARGLPFTAADQYELDEIRKLTKAVGKIARSLRVLITVVLGGMLGLILAKPLLETSDLLPWLVPHKATLEAVISFILAYIFTYVAWRMLQVVKGDQDLIELQSNFVVRAVERRQAKRFEDQQKKNSADAYKAPEGYGRIIQ